MSSPPTVTDTLRAARALIEKGWCQAALARDKTGATVEPGSERAVAYCMMGAIYAATHYTPLTAWERHETYMLAKQCRNRLFAANSIQDTLADWNDAPERTQAEVLALFDSAIAEEGLV